MRVCVTSTCLTKLPNSRSVRRFSVLLVAAGLALSVSLRAEEKPGPTDVDIPTYLKGKSVFERNCMVCHGERGDGKGEMAATLVPRPRSFREGMFKFRSTPSGKLPTDDDLRRTIMGGLSGTNMGKFGNLSAEEVDAVIGYLKFFSRTWRKSANYASALPPEPVPEWLVDGQARLTHAASGEALFQTYCAACHGPGADGKGPAAPLLRDIWGQPTPPTDLRQPFLRCGDTSEDLYRLLSTGMNGTPMPGYETTLTVEQRWNLVAYTLTIRRPVGPILEAAPETKE